MCTPCNIVTCYGRVGNYLSANKFRLRMHLYAKCTPWRTMIQLDRRSLLHAHLDLAWQPTHRA
jgi:hypothetical protein